MIHNWNKVRRPDREELSNMSFSPTAVLFVVDRFDREVAEAMQIIPSTNWPGYQEQFC